MVDALFDLDHVLRSKREQLSHQEANILMAWKNRARRDFYVGLGGASVFTWLATKRVLHPLRGALTLGAGAACGIWLTLRSLESSVDHILSLEGSQIQRELANVILKKHHGDPFVQNRLSKHFYSEEVYEDSSVDRPILRWRYKNFSGDDTRSQVTSYGEKTDQKENNIEKIITVKPQQIYASTAADYVRAAADTMENPFDLIFGIDGCAEDVPQVDVDVPQVDVPTASSKRQMRKERRSRRRHRRHHQEQSDG